MCDAPYTLPFHLWKKWLLNPRKESVILFHRLLRRINFFQEIGEDMVVLYEDQQKINLFAKKNSQLNDIKEQIAEKEVHILVTVCIKWNF